MEKLAANTVVDALKVQFGDKILAVEEAYDITNLTIDRNDLVTIFQWLYNHPVYQFQFLTTLCGMHYPHNPADKQMGMVYHLHSLVNNLRLRFKLYFPDNQSCEVPTLSGLFKSANWQERETFDFFGIRFTGHPDLRRIVNMDEMISFPLRKEHPLEDPTRDDKDDSMFGR